MEVVLSIRVVMASALISVIVLLGTLYAQPSDPELYINPEYNEIGYDSLFSITLEVDSSSVDIKAYSVRLRYDTNYVVIDSIIEGDLLSVATGLPTFFATRTGNTPDTIYADGAVLGDGFAASGAGVLFVIWLTATSDSSGYSDVEIVSYDFRDQNHQNLSYEAAGGVIRVCLTRGDVNSDYTIDIDDIVYTIEYVFNNGPAPIPNFLVGDVNCAEGVDIDDIVYLIDYVFQGGPPPCTLCYPE